MEERDPKIAQNSNLRVYFKSVPALNAEIWIRIKSNNRKKQEGTKLEIKSLEKKLEPKMLQKRSFPS
jgi:hypothetical protein